jgi:hypothetical protein
VTVAARGARQDGEDTDHEFGHDSFGLRDSSNGSTLHGKGGADAGGARDAGVNGGEGPNGGVSPIQCAPRPRPQALPPYRSPSRSLTLRAAPIDIQAPIDIILIFRPRLISSIFSGG